MSQICPVSILAQQLIPHPHAGGWANRIPKSLGTLDKIYYFQLSRNTKLHIYIDISSSHATPYTPLLNQILLKTLTQSVPKV